VVFALVLPLIFYVGFVASVPQDEGIYLHQAISLTISGSWSPYGDLKFMQSAETANPIFLLYSRHVYDLINKFFFWLTHSRYWTVMIFSYLCYVMEAVLCYILVRRFSDRKAAFISSLLLICFPVQLLHSTRLITELPMNCFAAVAMMLTFIQVFGAREAQNNSKWSILAGLSMGFAFVLKEPASLLMIPLLLIMAIFAARKIFYFFLGLAVFPLIDATIFRMTTGSFLTRYRVASLVHDNKYFVETSGKITSFKFPGNVFEIIGTPFYDFFYHAKNFFHAGGQLCANGYVGYMIMVATLSLVAVLTWAIINRRWRSPILISGIFCAVIYALMEFGPMHVYVNLHNKPWLKYALILKEGDSFKYSNYLAFPVSLFLGLILGKASARRSYHLLVKIFVGFLLLSSLYWAGKSRAILLSGVDSVRRSTRLIENLLRQNPGNRLVTDSAANDLLLHFSHDRLLTKTLNFSDLNLEDIRNRWKLGGKTYYLGNGPRPIDLSREMFVAQHNEFKSKLEAECEFKEIFRIYGSKTEARAEQDIYLIIPR
jgi:hypothetical protein